MSNIGTASVPMWRVKDGDTFVDGYMCRVDWEYELGLASGGNRVYPSLEDIKAHSKCASECGIVKVRVQFVEVVEPGDVL